MPVFPDAWLDELLSKSDIVSVVSEYVHLTPKGRRLWGCCPFHSEKTPSFSVTSDKQLYYCFGCHAGGSVIGFVMEMEKLTYVEAVKHLAQRAGMELPSEVDDVKLRREREHKERLYSACVEAARFYNSILMSDEGKAARSYLIKRGMDGKTVKRFGLGYAPDEWDRLIKHLTGKGFKREELISAGLAVNGSREGSWYDAYRGRVIFPIIATNGRVIGFGARTMGDGVPKYINTGDTPIYNKRSNLYAMNLMKGKQLSDLIMVEGYMDVISLHKAGVDNAVASLGTALTQQQAKLIKRYVSTVYICYDGDAAGQEATVRGMEILKNEGLTVRVISIPGGMDPDDYVKKYGKDGYLALKSSAMTLNGFKLETIAAKFDLSTENGRESYAKQACAFVCGLEPVERERYPAVIAKKSGLTVSAVKAQMGLSTVEGGNSITKNRNNRNEKQLRERNSRERTELCLAACMLMDKGAAVKALGRMEKEGLRFAMEGLDALVNELLLYYIDHDALDARAFAMSLSGAAAEHMAAAEAESDNIADPSAAADEYVCAILRSELEHRLERASREATDTPDQARRAELMQEIGDINRKLREIK